jgi:hypothetical protein
MVNILIEEKTCSVTGLCTKDQRPSRDHLWRDLHPLGHPIVLKSDHEFSPQCSNSPSVEPNILPEDPETSILYLRHGIPSVQRRRPAIVSRTGIILPYMRWQRSPFQNWYAVFLDSWPRPSKINLSPGFMLRNVDTGELRYYHPSQKNARFFDVPKSSVVVVWGSSKDVGFDCADIGIATR